MPITLSDVLTPSPFANSVWDDLLYTQDEFDNCPAIWSGQCVPCPAQEEPDKFPCAQTPLIDIHDADLGLQRIGLPAFQGTQILKCFNCGSWYGETGSGCPECNNGIEETFVCPSPGNCLHEDCPAFWWEGVSAGCSISAYEPDPYDVLDLDGENLATPQQNAQYDCIIGR